MKRDWMDFLSSCLEITVDAREKPKYNALMCSVIKMRKVKG